jgi:hypothetical protein
MKNVRNIAIVLVLAALVALLPAGGTGANAALAALRIAFYGTIAWVAAVMYREHRSRIYSLGDSRRAVLYGAIAVGVLTLSATSRLWGTSAGSVAWLVLMGACVYAVFAIVWAARKY